MVIKKGSIVKLDYEGRLESGEVFDSSKHGDHSHPLEFEVGSGQVIPGFDSAVIGMKVGDEREFKIESGEAYGEHSDEMVKEFPKAMFPKEQVEKIKEGMTLMLGSPQGQIPAKIAKITDDKIRIDLNHPLAGKNLIFKINILEVK